MFFLCKVCRRIRWSITRKNNCASSRSESKGRSVRAMNFES